jgi:hypothetical protein
LTTKLEPQPLIRLCKLKLICIKTLWRIKFHVLFVLLCLAITKDWYSFEMDRQHFRQRVQLYS